MRDFKGMKRQRGRNRKSGGGGNANATNPNRSWDSQGPENIKVRGNAQTVYERYQQLARDAASAGDRVLAENYSQHAEHYFRVLRALQPQKSFQDIAQRETLSQGFDIDFEDESGAQAAAILAAQQAAERAQQQGQEGRQHSRPEGRQDDGWRDRSNDERQDRDRADRQDRDGDDGEGGGRRETRRERWERRQEERRARFEREAAERDGREPSAEDAETLSVQADEQAVGAQPEAETPVVEAVQERPRRARGRPRRETTAPQTESEGQGVASEDQALPGFLTRPTTLTEPVEAEPKPRRRRAPKAATSDNED